MININIPWRLIPGKPRHRHQIARIEKSETRPGTCSITAAGQMQSARITRDQSRPRPARNSFDPDRVHRAYGLAQPASITILRRCPSRLIPAPPGTDIATVVTFCLFIVIIKATVFINHKKTHSECFAMSGTMSCRKINFRLIPSQGFQNKLANSI